MADKKQTPGGEPEPATEPETADPVDDAADDATDAEKDDPAGDVVDDAVGDTADDAADDAEATPALPDTQPASDDDDAADGDDNPADDSDQRPTGPFPTRVGWVVAAFLLFWPLAIPALVMSMRTAEANGTGNVRRAEKSSVRTLDFALGAVTLGVLGIVGLTVGIVAAPSYASSLPAGFVSAVRSFVPPALAGPLGITLPDDGAEVAAPTSSPSPSDDPYAEADPYAPDPSATDPYADVPADDLAETPEADDQTDPAGEPVPELDETATAGAEIPDLAVGDCFDTSATSGQTTLYRIPVVPCSTAHGGEIYAETTAPDSLARNGTAPSQQALWDAADAYCYPEFTKFVGMRWARSELLYWPIAPSEESWAEGDRRILCVVESEEPVTGSLKGAAR